MLQRRGFNIFSLLLREVALVAKDHSLLLTLLIAPLLYAFFYGSIYTYKAEEEVPICVVDEDRTGLSRTLIQQINNTQMVRVTAVTTLEAAKEQMYYGNTQGFLYIQQGMEKKVLSLQQANLVLALNAARFLPSSDVLGTITQVGLTVGAGVRLQYLQKAEGMNTEISGREVMAVKPDARPLFNNRVDYGTFLLPGLLAMILQQTLLIGLAGGTAAERQKNTLGQWMQAAGHNLSTALWGKGLFYFILFCCYAFFFLTVNFGVLELKLLGNAWELALVTALFLLSLIPMGILTGLLFRSQLLCTQLLAFTTYPIFLITGYTWPIQQLPEGLKAAGALLPITPFLNLYQGIVQQGAHITDRLPALYHLCILWCVYTMLCLLAMKILTRHQPQTCDQKPAY
jgi:ABC-2 type transport system permease protein